MKKGNIFIIAGLLLIVAALLLTGYNLWDDYRARAEAEDALGQLSQRIGADPVPIEGRPVSDSSNAEEIEYPDYVLNPGKDMPVENIDGKDYVGVIRISALERELPVLEGWDYTKLKTAPCRYTGTAYLDNMVICAHNYSFHFGPLDQLSYGDEVTFTDMDGNTFSYQVVEIETLKPSEIEKMIFGDWDLTLFTCTPGGVSRVTVRCERTA